MHQEIPGCREIRINVRQRPGEGVSHDDPGVVCAAKGQVKQVIRQDIGSLPVAEEVGLQGGLVLVIPGTEASLHQSFFKYISRYLLAKNVINVRAWKMRYCRVDSIRLYNTLTPLSSASAQASQTLLD